MLLDGLAVSFGLVSKLVKEKKSQYNENEISIGAQNVINSFKVFKYRTLMLLFHTGKIQVATHMRKLKRQQAYESSYTAKSAKVDVHVSLDFLPCQRLF